MWAKKVLFYHLIHVWHKAPKGIYFILHNIQDRWQQVAHPLHITLMEKKQRGEKQKEISTQQVNSNFSSVMNDWVKQILAHADTIILQFNYQ